MFTIFMTGKGLIWKKYDLIDYDTLAPSYFFVLASTTPSFATPYGLNRRSCLDVPLLKGTIFDCFVVK